MPRHREYITIDQKLKATKLAIERIKLAQAQHDWELQAMSYYPDTAYPPLYRSPRCAPLIGELNSVRAEILENKLTQEVLSEYGQLAEEKSRTAIFKLKTMKFMAEKRKAEDEMKADPNPWSDFVFKTATS